VAVLLANAYSTLVRGIPDLVLMLLIFYGGQIALNTLLEKLGAVDNLEIDPFTSGVLTIGFIYGAYMTETFRGAILAIPKGQMEAGMAFGMRPVQIFWRITLPQMVRLALPGFTNNWLVLMKSTALVSLLGLQDMTYLAKQAGAAVRGEIPNAPLLFLTFAALLYLAMTSVSMLVLGWLEKRYSVGVRQGTQ
jgi:arginine/ornithine transport system permease protein